MNKADELKDIVDNLGDKADEISDLLPDSKVVNNEIDKRIDTVDGGELSKELKARLNEE